MPKVIRGGKRLVGGDYHKHGKDLHYGDEFKTIKHFKVSGYDIKVILNNIRDEADIPLDTATPNRVYITLMDNKADGKIKSIIFYDENGRRSKQYDFGHTHKDAKDGHVHYGYNHKENDWDYLSEEDKKLVDKIRKKMYN